MIPTYFIQINEVHLNANGKIIRTGLPEPDNNSGAGSEFLLPTNDLQAKLVEILLTVLQVEKIGINSNFLNWEQIPYPLFP